MEGRKKERKEKVKRGEGQKEERMEEEGREEGRGNKFFSKAGW